MSPNESQLLLASGQLISLSQAARLTPYSAEYLALRARQGKLKAVKIGRDWMATEQIVVDYVKEQESRHNRLFQRFQNSFIANQAGFAGIKMLISLGMAILATSGFLVAVQIGIIPNAKFAVNLALPVHHQQPLAAATQPIQQRGSAANSPSDSLADIGQVLGLSTSDATLQSQIENVLNQYLAEGKLAPYLSGVNGAGLYGPKGDKGDSGITTVTIASSPGLYYAPTSYYQPNQTQNFNGGSLAGFTELSSDNFNTNQANVATSLTVNGTTNLQGNTTLGTTTISSLSVNGVAVTGGSSSQWTSTSTDIYYNTGNVGIGTTIPTEKLNVVGGNLKVEADYNNLGDEQFNQPTFSPHDKWSTFGDMSFVGNVPTYDATGGNGFGTIYQSAGNMATPLVLGNSYQFSITLQNVVPGDIVGYNPDGTTYTPANGTHTYNFLANNTEMEPEFDGSTGSLEIVSVSVKEAPGGSGNFAGNINVGGQITGGGTQGMLIDANGNSDVFGGIGVDSGNQNNGDINYTLNFGGVGSGEGIGSNRVSGDNVDGLDFYTDFINRMSITNDGNVGIGTTTPSIPLAVSSDDVAKIGISSSGASGSGLVLGINGGYNAGIFYDEAANGMEFRTNGTDYTVDRMVIDDNGNVGIGTTSPTAKLDIASGDNTELVSNGDFATNNLTDWTAVSGWNASSGEAVHTAGQTAVLKQTTVSIEEGETYSYSFNINGTTAGEICSFIGDPADGNNIDGNNQNGIVSGTFTASASGDLEFDPTCNGDHPTGDFDGSIDNISITQAHSTIFAATDNSGVKGLIVGGANNVTIQNFDSLQGGIASYPLNVQWNDLNTNGITDVLNLTHLTNGSGAVGNGSGIVFQGNRVSANSWKGARIAGVMENVNDGTEAMGLSFWTTSGGSALSNNPSNSNSGEKMRITANGYVGIGTGSPEYLLEVGSADVASGTVARFENENGTCDINPTNAGLQCSSDVRLKHNIDSMASSSADLLQNVLSLNPVYFNWNSEASGTPEHPGFIAQQVEQIFPDLVSTDSNGYKSLSYSNFAPYLVSAIQVQQKEILSLQGSLTGNATSSNLFVYNPSSFSGDSVGEAKILAGSTSVRVTFSQAYEYQPIVTITQSGEPIAVFASVDDVDDTGFTIKINQSQPSGTQFNWHSFASPSEQLTVSDGSKTDIQLVVANQATASAPIVSGGSISDVPDSDIASSSTPPSDGSVLGDSTSTLDSTTTTTPDSPGPITPPDSSLNPPVDSGSAISDVGSNVTPPSSDPPVDTSTDQSSNTSDQTQSSPPPVDAGSAGQ